LNVLGAIPQCCYNRSFVQHGSKKPIHPAREVILEVENVSKSFPGVKALDRVSFDLRKGEVACFGRRERGWQVNAHEILSGVYQPDEGTIRYKGKAVSFRDVNDSHKAGVGIIYQEAQPPPPSVGGGQYFHWQGGADQVWHAGLRRR